MSSCSLVIQTFTARASCNAASDWVASCAIIIKRRRVVPLKSSTEHSAPSNLTTNQKFTLNGREVLMFPSLQG
jgi:hypothetical protein